MARSHPHVTFSYRRPRLEFAMSLARLAPQLLLPCSEQSITRAGRHLTSEKFGKNLRMCASLDARIVHISQMELAYVLPTVFM
jgi:hypothetical protein